MKCPYCGQKNDLDEEKCVYCGKSLKRAHKEQNIILTGMIAIVFVLLIGTAAFMFAMRGLDMSLIDQNTINTAIAEAQDDAEETADPTAVPETEAAEGQEQPEPTQEAAEVQVGGTLVNASDIREVMDLQGYSRAVIADAQATSTTPADDGSDLYGPQSAIDDSDDTSWQEGADGQGVGEQLILTLDRDYSVKYIFLKLGSWTSDNSYYSNNRPETLNVTVGGNTFSISFPDEKTEYCIELSQDVTTNQVVLQIQNAYVGSAWDDTCITNVEIEGY